MLLITLMGSTMIAYAWWNQINESVSVTHIQIGYGTRIRLTNLTTANQGILVSQHSMLADQPGYTSMYQFAFLIEFTEDLSHSNLMLHFSDIHLRKDDRIEHYSLLNKAVSMLDLKVISTNQTLRFINQEYHQISGTDEFLVFSPEAFSVPESRFEFQIAINDQPSSASTFIQGSVLSFDLNVEVIV